MKKIISYLLVITFFIASCDIQYDGNTRLQVTGKVLDENNAPISNRDVKIFAVQENPYGETNQIGVGKTDSQGIYTIYFPRANNFDSYHIEINDDNNELSEMIYLNVKNENFINYSLTLPNSKLFLNSNLADLHVAYNQINTDNQLQNVEFIGEIITNRLDLNNQLVNIDDSYYKRVKKNQTIELKFTLYNTTTQLTTIQSEFITIANTDSVNYTLNY